MADKLQNELADIRKHHMDLVKKVESLERLIQATMRTQVTIMDAISYAMKEKGKEQNGELNGTPTGDSGIPSVDSTI